METHNKLGWHEAREQVEGIGIEAVLGSSMGLNDLMQDDEGIMEPSTCFWEGDLDYSQIVEEIRIMNVEAGMHGYRLVVFFEANPHGESTISVFKVAKQLQEGSEVVVKSVEGGSCIVELWTGVKARPQTTKIPMRCFGEAEPQVGSIYKLQKNENGAIIAQELPSGVVSIAQQQVRAGLAAMLG